MKKIINSILILNIIMVLMLMLTLVIQQSQIKQECMILGEEVDAGRYTTEYAKSTPTGRFCADLGE